MKNKKSYGKRKHDSELFFFIVTLLFLSGVHLILLMNTDLKQDEETINDPLNLKFIRKCEEYAGKELDFIKPSCDKKIGSRECVCQETATGIKCIKYAFTEHTKRCVEWSKKTIPERYEEFTIMAENEENKPDENSDDQEDEE